MYALTWWEPLTTRLGEEVNSRGIAVHAYLEMAAMRRKKDAAIVNCDILRALGSLDKQSTTGIHQSNASVLSMVPGEDTAPQGDGAFVTREDHPAPRLGCVASKDAVGDLHVPSRPQHSPLHRVHRIQRIHRVHRNHRIHRRRRQRMKKQLVVSAPSDPAFTRQLADERQTEKSEKNP